MPPLWPHLLQNFSIYHIIRELLSDAFHLLFDVVDDKPEDHLRFNQFSKLSQFINKITVNVHELHFILVDHRQNFLDVWFSYFPQVIKDFVVWGLVFRFLIVILWVLLHFSFLLLFFFLKSPLFRDQLLQILCFHMFQHFLGISQLFQSEIAFIVYAKLLSLSGCFHRCVHKLFLAFLLVFEGTLLLKFLILLLSFLVKGTSPLLFPYEAWWLSFHWRACLVLFFLLHHKSLVSPTHFLKVIVWVKIK